MFIKLSNLSLSLNLTFVDFKNDIFILMGQIIGDLTVLGPSAWFFFNWMLLQELTMNIGEQLATKARYFLEVGKWNLNRLYYGLVYISTKSKVELNFFTGYQGLGCGEGGLKIAGMEAVGSLTKGELFNELISKQDMSKNTKPNGKLNASCLN